MILIEAALRNMLKSAFSTSISQADGSVAVCSEVTDFRQLRAPPLLTIIVGCMVICQYIEIDQK